jgi:ankyrin repeat protein
MKTGLRRFTMLLYPAAWETNAALLENDYGMEIDAKSNDGHISMYAAANHGHLPIVELLLKHGADEIVRDKKGNNMLMTAIDIGHVDLVCWLMQNITHTDMKPNAEYVTPLM